MKSLLILGAGTGGTIVANRMRKRLPNDWAVTIVDPVEQHLYQPGLLFVPFGRYDPDEIVRPRRDTFRRGVQWVRAGVERVDTEARQVELSVGGPLGYDLLVIASGAELRPERTPGLLGDGWGRSVFDFYTLEGAVGLRAALDAFEGGRLVIDVARKPIKCPVAPIELACLADEFFTRRKLRDRVELVLALPGPTAFAKPLANERITPLLAEKGITVETGVADPAVDADAGLLRAGERELPFDLLVSVPEHGGATFVERSGLGDARGFVPTDPRTLAVKGLERVFAIGDATDAPTSKAGSVAHFEAEVVCDNLLLAAKGEAPEPLFDGHANCFLETGWGKALLLDFNYETQPLPGHFPTPWGPFTLLGESRANHLGKLAFHWLYWNALLPGRPLPVGAEMSLLGKEPPDAPSEGP